MVPYPTFAYEKKLWDQGLSYVAGIDEVGRGAFAGPVVAAAVIFPKECIFSSPLLSQIHDSKLLTPKKRTVLSELIKQEAQSFAIAEVPVSVINKKGIGQATQEAFSQAISSLSTPAEYCLIDAFPIQRFAQTKQNPIIHGDYLSVSIAAASIIAKVYRDTLMEKLHESLSVYNFKQNKGYGTAFHREQLKKHGLSVYHRTSFRIKCLNSSS